MDTLDNVLVLVLVLIAGGLLLGFATGVAFGCRTKRRRRLWIGEDDPPISHFRPRR